MQNLQILRGEGNESSDNVVISMHSHGNRSSIVRELLRGWAWEICNSGSVDVLQYLDQRWSIQPERSEVVCHLRNAVDQSFKLQIEIDSGPQPPHGCRTPRGSENVAGRHVSRRP